MNVISRLLKKNTSTARIVGFILSNFLGLVIILGGLQFYQDAKAIWEAEDSFISTDYLVINKKITSENTFGGANSAYTQEEVADINSQPWVRRSAAFTTADYRVWASLNQNGRGMSTSMFFEAIPDSYVDVPSSQWAWREGSDEVPLIISKDYLTLYNFGFASAAGLPQMSEGLMSGIPLTLTLSSEDGQRKLEMHGRVAGYSNRLNTILVPQNFIEWSNEKLGSGETRQPSRLIIDVNSPGDVAITKYMAEKSYEIAGDKSAASASFLLKVVVGIVLAIGIVITLLSFFILMLSVSLLMEKNRDKLHSLLMLGYDTKEVGKPYDRIVIQSSLIAFFFAIAGVFAMRCYYLSAIKDLGADPAAPWLVPSIGVILTLAIIIFNLIAVKKKVINSWRIKN